MLIARNGVAPRVHPDAKVAASAQIVGNVQIGAGGIVHAATVLPEGTRVGIRHIAAPTPEGFISTADVEVARQAIAEADFFEKAFGATDEDQARLHQQVISTLLAEVHGWRDEPLS